MGYHLISGRLKTGNGTIIHGLSAVFIKIRIATDVIIIVTRMLKDPFRGIITMKRVREKRSTIQGMQGIGKYVKTDGRYFFSENIPGWPSLAFNSFIEAEIERVSDHTKPSSLSTVIFAITSDVGWVAAIVMNGIISRVPTG